MRKSFLVALATLVLLSFSVLSSDPSKGKERLIGMMIKQALETYHSRNMKVDDEVSSKAFKQFLKGIDPFKSFLLRSDIKELEQFKLEMDDQMVSGDHRLINLTAEIMRKRISAADELRKKYFEKKGSFKFDKKEGIELDGKKKSYPKTEKQFAESWRKLFKHMTLTRYLALVEEQKKAKDPKNKDKNKKKSKKNIKKKPKTDAQMLKEAHAETSKFYARYFKRKLEQSRYDQLDTFFNAITTVYDPHTLYLPPRKKEDFDIDISGSLEGIGAVLQEDGQHIKVVKIILGGAAWRQKELEVNDIILEVGEGDKKPVSLVEMKVGDAVTYIRGKKGTEVRLTVKKSDGSRRVIPIIRDVVQNEVTFAKSSVLEHKKLGVKIGYIQLPKFYRDFGTGSTTCTKDVAREIANVKKHGVDGIILDLRNNGGGALEDARQMSGLFIETGPIVQIKGYDGDVEVLSDKDSRIQYDGPLVVMVNRFSASASEILAAAMQDYSRGVVVGSEFSHGKGTVQAVLDLNRGSLKNFLGEPTGALKVTIQKFYRITGASTQFKGVTPDIILPDENAYLENREQDLDYALPWDVISAQEFTPWNKFKYDIPFLKKQSAKRIRKNKGLIKIVKLVKALEKKKDDTYDSLNKKTLIAEQEERKQLYEKLKLNYKNKDLVVSNFNPNIHPKQKMSGEDKKKWDEDIKKISEEWVKAMKEDPILAESVFIMNDIVNSLKGKIAKK